jgi:FAD/FMN-containing dehydrogenase
MGDATAPALNETISRLASIVRGRVVSPLDEAYDSARKVYNGDIDRRPLAIVQCADVADVIRSVHFAREQKLPVAIRGGGHSVPGFGVCDNGLAIDLCRLKGIRVDPAKRTVRVEGGCTWGDVDHATHVFGMATPGGVISTTGVGGLTTGGGFGYLTRRYGLACDNLLSADVVTADGELRTASPTENPDLFWAIRGGSGNFGILTSLEFRLYPVSTVFAGPILYPLEKAGDVLHLFRDLMATAPRELSVFFAFLIVPPGPPFPETLHMKTLCGLVCSYCGDPARGDSITKPLREFGPPLFAHIGPMPYPMLQSIFDPLLPPGLHHYWKGDFVREISDPYIAAHLKHGPSIPTVNSAMHIYPMDGAVHDVPADATAFGYRDVKFVHVIAAVTPERAALPGYRDWVRAYFQALHPLSAGGAYVNFLMEEGEERIARSFSGNYTRLAEVKAKYDPDNFFHVNQNIKPAAA